VRRANDRDAVSLVVDRPLRASRSMIRAIAVVILLAVPSGTAFPQSPFLPDHRTRLHIGVILAKGDTLDATCVEPAPFEMVRITTPSGKQRYVAPVRIVAVIDEWGEDRTRELLERRETLGTPPPRAPKPPGRGLQVGPRSVTKSFRITETTLLRRVGSGGQGHGPLGGHFDFDLGGMKNTGDHTAVGATVFVGTGNQYSNAGARVRVRHWLSRTASIDFAPGIIAFEHYVSGRARSPGFSMQLSWNPSRYVSLTTELLSVRDRETGMVGARVGQWPGAVTGALAMFTAFFMSSMHSMH